MKYSGLIMFLSWHDNFKGKLYDYFFDRLLIYYYQTKIKLKENYQKTTRILLLKGIRIRSRSCPGVKRIFDIINITTRSIIVVVLYITYYTNSLILSCGYVDNQAKLSSSTGLNITKNVDNHCIFCALFNDLYFVNLKELFIHIFFDIIHYGNDISKDA